jgi:hypothetical protein
MWALPRGKAVISSDRRAACDARRPEETNQIDSDEASTGTPGPMVEDTEIFLR